MNKHPDCPMMPHPSRVSRAVTALLLGGTMLLTGCASQTQRNLEALPAVDNSSLGKIGEHLAAESAKLRQHQEVTRKALEQRASAVAPEPIAPKYDPLEDIVVSVNLRNASLSAVLQVLAEQSKMNMLVEPDVLMLDKRANLYLNRVSARELFRSVLEVFDLAGQVDGNTLKISLYDQRLFNLDFLNTRMDMNINAGGNVFGAMSTGGGSGGGSSGGDLIRGNVNVNGGSSRQVEPYNEIEANLKRILGSKEGQPERRPALPRERLGERKEGVSDVALQAEQANPLGAERDRRELGAVYSLNRSSGTLYVNARPSQLRVVEKLIDRYAKVMGRQVLIEAQLLDVELNDQFQYGVDWDLLRNNLAGAIGDTAANLGSATSTLPGVNGLPSRVLSFPSRLLGMADGRSGGLTYSDSNVAVALNLLRSFGNVKVLSNPSIRARNNSPALLSVGSSNRFVSKSTVTTSNPGGGASTITADVQTDSTFSGVVVGVVPFISEQGDIDLMIHPMQTEVDATSLQLQDVGGGNKVTLPKISYKGMTTTLNIKDGDTVIIGGLIDQKAANNDRGLPGLSDIPGLGRLFGAETTSNRSRELIMVLRVKKL